MKKVFKCVENDENELRQISVAKLEKSIKIKFENINLGYSDLIFLSKPDAIEFCRELLKQIAMLE